MKALNFYKTVRGLLDTAASFTEIADKKQTLVYAVNAPATLYLQTETADLRLRRWAEARIEVTIKLQVALGWRYAAEQDEAGVYIVTKRRAVVGGLSRATFEIAVPQDTHLLLRLNQCTVNFAIQDGLLELAPPDAESRIIGTGG